jgi:hypothetical protein
VLFSSRTELAARARTWEVACALRSAPKRFPQAQPGGQRRLLRASHKVVHTLHDYASQDWESEIPAKINHGSRYWSQVHLTQRSRECTRSLH